ncbi:MAG TPA: ACP synthase [Cyanobacteria bacterium UBA11369]|nr:ACP synthase [Cyanobacteria bacterium UBA8553]HAZ44675.1 ACP synthase [Cyanobacteria bacterium UBA11371]HBE34031.1 ACP synthase [Cyanobacteria bacterium UBA11368]HBE54312.1 ACP synthase [Cyanobacteria bacterium UBA11369]
MLALTLRAYPESDWTGGAKGIGIDIASISRITRLIDCYDLETLTLLFAPAEIDRCESASDSYQAYAICFATKEAVGKALGTGLAGIGWNEIEANITQGKLTVALHGEARLQAKRRGIRRWLATWFYWDRHVLVHVLAQ